MLRSTMKSWQRALALLLAALALGGAAILLFPRGSSHGQKTGAGESFPRVTWSESAPRVEKGEWLLVDARDEDQFGAQHIPGAISLPARSYPEILQFFAEDHGTNKTVVVYCGSEDCDLSTELASRLRDETHCADMRILEGGFLSWRRGR